MGMEETGCCCHQDRNKSPCCSCESCADHIPNCVTYCGDEQLACGGRGSVCCPPSQYGCHFHTNWLGQETDFVCTSPGCAKSSSMASHCRDNCGDADISDKRVGGLSAPAEAD